MKNKLSLSCNFNSLIRESSLILSDFIEFASALIKLSSFCFFFKLQLLIILKNNMNNNNNNNNKILPLLLHIVHSLLRV